MYFSSKRYGWTRPVSSIWKKITENSASQAIPTWVVNRGQFDTVLKVVLMLSALRIIACCRI